jgi:NAD-dependent dihydropyrimidine dehydrogenase PreA subunit
VEESYDQRQALAEARRCLACDARKVEVRVNAEHCKECGYCAEVCAIGAFAPADRFNAKGYRPMVCKSSDWCVGCMKCFYACPDFAIDVQIKSA